MTSLFRYCQLLREYHALIDTDHRAPDYQSKSEVLWAEMDNLWGKLTKADHDKALACATDLYQKRIK